MFPRGRGMVHWERWVNVWWTNAYAPCYRLAYHLDIQCILILLSIWKKRWWVDIKKFVIQERIMTIFNEVLKNKPTNIFPVFLHKDHTTSNALEVLLHKLYLVHLWKHCLIYSLNHYATLRLSLYVNTQRSIYHPIKHLWRSVFMENSYRFLPVN